MARLGSADSNGPDMFGRVVDVALDATGRVWVADGQSFHIQVFDAEGRHVRTIGRKGGGPAEFGEIGGMDWGPDGNLWVLDGGNARYAVYDTAGRLVTTHPRETGVNMVPWPGGFDARGSLYDIAAVPGGDTGIRFAVVRYDARLQPADTFLIPPFEGDF
ncbi:MAG TPA: 6-bladed beta-propeller, partial [Longimicrobium sp.]|nr:6-bladed beta-propeller [Longimicrobium sp.]